MANFHSIVILAIIAGAALLPEAYGRPGCEYIADLLDTMKVCNTNSTTEQCCSVRVPVVRMLEALQFSYLLNYSDICDCIRGVNDGIRSLAKCPGARAEQVDGLLGTIGTACAAGQTADKSIV